MKISKILEVLQEWPPFDFIYNVHNLYWELKLFKSINLTWDWRIVFKINEKDKLIVLYDIWTHSELYS
jgi:mRNA-degrading endonuclease YafQ of YafQ-DinJ toxin-antitoxin module